MRSPRPTYLVPASLAAILACGGTDSDVTQPEPPQPRAAKPVHREDFTRALISSSTSDYSIPRTIGELINAQPLAALGTLVAVEPGRKEYLLHGCDTSDEDESADPCASGRVVPLYASYVNLIVHPDRILKGTLNDPSADFAVERPWPNNLPIDGLEQTAPIGTDVIVIGEPVPNAREQALPLEREGIARPEDVAENLFQVHPYGLMIRDERGQPTGPLVEGRVLFASDPDDIDGLEAFDRLAEEIARVVGETP